MIRKMPVCINPFMPIPTVYANALSYSEVQTMIITKLNEVINELNARKANVYFSKVEVDDLTVSANGTTDYTITAEHVDGLVLVGCVAYNFATSDDLIITAINVDDDTDELTLIVKNLSDSSVTDDLNITLIYASELKAIQ